MSSMTGLVLDSGYRQPPPAPIAVVERPFPIWTVVFVVLAAMAAFAPSLAVTLVADLREPAPAVCAPAGEGGVGGVAASAAARRATTEAVVAGHAPDEGRC